MRVTSGPLAREASPMLGRSGVDVRSARLRVTVIRVDELAEGR